jgi:hypothetical protein
MSVIKLIWLKTVQENDNFSLCEAIVNLWEQDQINLSHVVYVNTTVP